MTVLTVTEEAIAALAQLSEELRAASDAIRSEAELLAAAFENHADGLGPHAASIQVLLDEVWQMEKNASVPVKKLGIKLQRSAMIRRKLLEENRYEGTQRGASSAGTAAAGGITTSAVAGSSAERSVSVEERTLFELDTLERDLGLTDGDSSVIQVGGYDRDVTTMIKGRGYESHHIPPQSVFEDKRGNLPTIALTKEDHEKTSSFRGRMKHRYKPHIPGGAAEFPTHKQSVQENVEQGFLAEMIRNEIYEIREAFGSKYDGAIRQYLTAVRDYIRKNGVPKVLKSEKMLTE